MADLTINVALLRHGSAASIFDSEVGEPTSLARGDVIYEDVADLDLDGNPRVKKADANDIAAKAFAKGVCIVDAALGQRIWWVSIATDFVPGATLAVGVPYVLSSNPGKICPVSDMASGWFYTPLFVGKTTTTADLFVAPSGVQRP